MAPPNTNIALIFIFSGVFCICLAVGGYMILQRIVRTFPPPQHSQAEY
jgi:hypothetical protein